MALNNNLHALKLMDAQREYINGAVEVYVLLHYLD